MGFHGKDHKRNPFIELQLLGPWIAASFFSISCEVKNSLELQVAINII
jgi:hypothetical protein